MAIDKVWVLAEVGDSGPTPVTLELLTEARSVASTVEAVAWGADAAALAGPLGRVRRDHALRRRRPGRHAARRAGGRRAGRARRRAATRPTPSSLPATYEGRDVAGRLSAKLGRPVLTNVTGLVETDGGLSSQHPVFGGSHIVTARFTGEGPAIFVIRAKSFAAEPSGGAAAAVVAAPVPDVAATNTAKVVERHVEERSGPKLDEAAVVVSGGRGLGEAANYALIEELAKLLHGAAGASRAIVDAGWVPYSHQVGQTGKTVKPTVYVACGISGATQHLVGMKGSKNIIAINKDQEAPIFSVADLGIVGDVHKVLPALIEALKAKG